MKLDYLVKLHNTLHHYLPILFHKKDKVVWCCSGFKGLYKEQGQRGFSIYYDEEQLNRPVFFLIFRSLDPGVLEESQMKKHSLKLEADAPVTLSAQMVLTYCPSCGKNLIRWYFKQINVLLNEIDNVSLKDFKGLFD